MHSIRLTYGETRAAISVGLSCFRGGKQIKELMFDAGRGGNDLATGGQSVSGLRIANPGASFAQHGDCAVHLELDVLVIHRLLRNDEGGGEQHDQGDQELGDLDRDGAGLGAVLGIVGRRAHGRSPG